MNNNFFPYKVFNRKEEIRIVLFQVIWDINLVTKDPVFFLKADNKLSQLTQVDPLNKFKPMEGWMFSEDGRFIVVKDNADMFKVRYHQNAMTKAEVKECLPHDMRHIAKREIWREISYHGEKISETIADFEPDFEKKLEKLKIIFPKEKIRLEWSKEIDLSIGEKKYLKVLELINV